ncbi:hypothetical protein AXF42_Ash013595 [Apostasia shenzhenica]|uniref:Uncharacterized protein n=1 Tax=Apostasia shenzhenica TaxID=1088818 RepID=A0A2I0APC7_9ASPA|nr:hypothetical protein AXF42_Ash013595 [Apostasia shenzhenica]
MQNQAGIRSRPQKFTTAKNLVAGRRPNAKIKLDNPMEILIKQKKNMEIAGINYLTKQEIMQSYSDVNPTGKTEDLESREQACSVLQQPGDMDAEIGKQPKHAFNTLCGIPLRCRDRYTSHATGIVHPMQLA